MAIWISAAAVRALTSHLLAAFFAIAEKMQLADPVLISLTRSVIFYATVS